MAMYIEVLCSFYVWYTLIKYAWKREFAESEIFGSAFEWCAMYTKCQEIRINSAWYLSCHPYLGNDSRKF